jgi:hypothetical protein
MHWLSFLIIDANHRSFFMSLVSCHLIYIQEMKQQLLVLKNGMIIILAEWLGIGETEH